MARTTLDYPSWLSSLDEARFDTVADAAESVLTLHEALANDDLTLLGELFRDSGETPIEAWEHYPPDDSRDPNSGAMFYYHAHDPQEWNRLEHGHFHLFVRPEADASFTHVMAISMTPYGLPNALFATNGWVTDETILPSQEVMQMLEERWDIARARPSWLVVQWLNAVLKLMQPYAAELLQKRDALLGWTDGNPPSQAILEDRDRHILSDIPIDFMAMLQAVQDEVQKRFIN
jgi:hypothetical protein